MKSLAIIGAGSWGTALAVLWARQGYTVRLWVYEPDLAAAMALRRENALYLPGIRLPDSISPSAQLGDVLLGAEVAIVVAVPSHVLRATFTALAPLLPTAPLVLATKGLEENTLLRVSQVAEAVLGPDVARRLATLSGPTFAREIAAGEPAAVVLAARNPELAAALQHDLAGPSFRLYTSDDVTGVELAAALKNVIALAAGICQGLGLGSNTRAALIARGLAEMVRLVTACGGRSETLAGLAGLGDLVLTCTGDLSRNRQLGIALGQGQSLAEARAATPMVAEGVRTTAAAAALAARHGVAMPITDQMFQVLFAQRTPHTALAALMARAPRAE